MRMWRAAFGLVAASTLAGSSVLATSNAARATTYGGHSTGFVVLELAAGVALFLAAAALLATPAGVAPGAVIAAIEVAWFAPVLVGWEGGPTLLRTVGLAAAPLIPAGLLAAAALVPAPRRALTVLAGLAAIALVSAAAGLAVVRDPISDLYCWSDCDAAPLLAGAHFALTRRLTGILLALGVMGCLTTTVIASGRLRRASSPSAPALATLVVAGLVFASYPAALYFAPREVPARPVYASLFAARSLSLIALGAGFAWLALRPRLIRARVSNLALDMVAGDDLRGRLAAALGDGSLRLGFPVGRGERVVDDAGATIVFDGTRRVTPVVGDGEVVALVESDVVTRDALERELGPAAQLALGNERLRAEALARLLDVTAARARIVETADMTRRRIERDLHDGAQQRMLALGYELRVAATIAGSDRNEGAVAVLEGVLERALCATRELREIAHGIFPAELANAGLEAALASLADTRRVWVVTALPSARRFRSDIEAAAYAVVAEAAETGAALEVSLGERDGCLQLEVVGPVDWAVRMIRIEDRVGASGGSVHAEGDRLAVWFTA